MTIDISSEELLTLAQAARRYRPPDARPLAPSTIWRWHKKGISGVRLETTCVGGTRLTSTEAMRRFAVAVTLARSMQDVAAEPNAESGTRSAAIKKRLQEAGLGDQHANRPTTSRSTGKVTSPSSTTAGLDGWVRSDVDGGTELPADLDEPP
jgi:hypothetical protein